MSDSITCPKCTRISHNPKDGEFRWCSNCNQFHYGLVDQEPIYFNPIVGSLQASIRNYLGEGYPFSLQFEEFVDGGQRYWRALIRLGNGVWKFSHRPHQTPTDALRELVEMVDQATR